MEVWRTKGLGNFAAEIQGILGGMALGHQEHLDTLRPQGTGGKAGGDAAVNPAGEGHHQPAAF